MLFGNDTTLGLDLGSTGLRAVELTRMNGKTRIQRWATVDFAEEITDWRAAEAGELAGRIKNALRKNNIKSQWVAHSVSGDAVAPQYFNFPQLLSEDVEEAVRIEVETALPFPAEEALVSYLLFPEQRAAQGKARTHGLAIAADGDFVKSRLEPMRKAGLETFCLETDSTACANAYLATKTGNGQKLDGAEARPTTAILNIGHRYTNLALIGQDGTLLIRDVPWAGGTLTAAIASALSISKEEAERLKRAHWERGNSAVPELGQRLPAILESCGNDCVVRLRDTIQYWVGERLVSGLGNIKLTGGGSLVHGIEDYFSEAFGTPVERWAPALDLAGEFTEALRPIAERLTVATGLALREFGTRKR